jgi:hypothetical protein
MVALFQLFAANEAVVLLTPSNVSGKPVAFDE